MENCSTDVYHEKILHDEILDLLGSFALGTGLLIKCRLHRIYFTGKVPHLLVNRRVTHNTSLPRSEPFQTDQDSFPKRALFAQLCSTS